MILKLKGTLFFNVKNVKPLNEIVEKVSSIVVDEILSIPGSQVAHYFLQDKIAEVSFGDVVKLKLATKKRTYCKHEASQLYKKYLMSPNYQILSAFEKKASRDEMKEQIKNGLLERSPWKLTSVTEVYMDRNTGFAFIDASSSSMGDAVISHLKDLKIAEISVNIPKVSIDDLSKTIRKLILTEIEFYLDKDQVLLSDSMVIEKDNLKLSLSKAEAIDSSYEVYKDTVHRITKIKFRTDNEVIFTFDVKNLRFTSIKDFIEEYDRSENSSSGTGLLKVNLAQKLFKLLNEFIGVSYEQSKPF